MPDAPDPPPDKPASEETAPKEEQQQQNLVGDYANFARIGHTPGDFVLDFGQIIPEGQQVALKRRLIMSPVAVKSLLRALEDNIRKYEAKFGPIPNDPTQ